MIGNDEIIQVRRVIDQPIRKRPLPAEQPAHCVGLPDHHAGNAGQAGVFGNLIGHVVPNGRFDLGPQLFRQVHVTAQAFFIVVRQLGIARCFHEQRGKGALKSGSDPGGGVDHPDVGGR